MKTKQVLILFFATLVFSFAFLNSASTIYASAKDLTIVAGRVKNGNGEAFSNANITAVAKDFQNQQPQTETVCMK